MVHLRFIVNVVVDEAHRVAAAFAGDPFAAHAAGCAFLKPYCAVGAVPADIVVTGNGGAPLDQNIYQSVKCMTAAEATARPDAVLIVCAECADGTGSEGLYDALKTCASPRALLDEAAATPMDATRPDQWEYQILARILDKHAVIFVTGEQNAELVRDMKMTYAPTLAEAVRMALEIKCPRADFTVIPNGVSVIVT